MLTSGLLAVAGNVRNDESQDLADASSKRRDQVERCQKPLAAGERELPLEDAREERDYADGAENGDAGVGDLHRDDPASESADETDDTGRNGEEQSAARVDAVWGR